MELLTAPKPATGPRQLGVGLSAKFHSANELLRAGRETPNDHTPDDTIELSPGLIVRRFSIHEEFIVLANLTVPHHIGMLAQSIAELANSVVDQSARLVAFVLLQSCVCCGLGLGPSPLRSHSARDQNQRQQPTNSGTHAGSPSSAAFPSEAPTGGSVHI